MISHTENTGLPEDNNLSSNSYTNSTENNGSSQENSKLGDAEADQQFASNDADFEDKEKVTDDDENNTTPQAVDIAANPSADNLASSRRDASRAPTRANEATDRNNSGSGGMVAGGV